MKYRITKAAFDKLSDDMKAEYGPADGKAEDKATHYQLDVEGLPDLEGDAGELKRANTRLKEEKTSLTEELAEVNDELKTIKASQTTGDKDVAKVTARYERKLTDAKTDADARVEKIKGSVSKIMLENAANALATEISTNPKLMVPHVTERLTVEFDADDVPVVKVLKDGKASDVKVADLKKELVDNKDFAPIIRGTKASGGGAPASTPLNPGGAGPVADGKPVDLSKSDPASRQALKDIVAAKVAERQQKSA